MRRLAGIGAAALAAALVCAAEDGNARWTFLRTNLQVFPGTEELFEPDDRLFWRLRANLSNVRAAEQLPGKRYPFRVSTDEQGRRLSADASDGAPTVLFLGDSCTFGIPVDDREAFPSVAAELVGAQAINAGVPGYSAFQGRLFLEAFHEGARAVVISFWINGRTSWDHLSDAEHLELVEAERAAEFSRHRVTRLLRRVTPGSRPRLSEEEFSDELHRMIKRARAIGAEPLLVVWPAADQMGDGAEHPRQRIIRETAQAADAALVNLIEPFRTNGGAELFVDAVHATARGYRVAAHEIADALRPMLTP